MFCVIFNDKPELFGEVLGKSFLILCMFCCVGFFCVCVFLLLFVVVVKEPSIIRPSVGQIHSTRVERSRKIN